MMNNAVNGVKSITRLSWRSLGAFVLGLMVLVIYIIFGGSSIIRDFAYYHSGSVILSKAKKISKINFHSYGNKVNYTIGVVFDICGDKLIGVDNINDELFIVDLVINKKQIIMKTPDDDGIWRVSSDGRFMVLDSREHFYIVDIAKKRLVSKGKAYSACMSPFGDGALALAVDDNRVIITNISNMKKAYMSFAINTSRSLWNYDFKNKRIYISSTDDCTLKRYDWRGNVRLMKLPFLYDTVNLLWQPDRDELWVTGMRAGLFNQWFVYDNNGVLLGRIANAPDAPVFQCRSLLDKR